MELQLLVFPRKKAAVACAWQSLLCLRPCRQKKNVTYSIYIHKLLNQMRSPGASCLVAAALASLGSPRLLGDMALEAARFSHCGRRCHFSHQEVLLAMELVLLQELCKLPAGSSGCELLLRGQP